MPAKPPSAAGSAGDSTPSAKRCPECGKPANPATLPFCSPRCRDVDLNRWLSGSYVIPGKETDPEDAE
ncbi:DNA gyrase inhibitor YacG [Bradyrhizobium sp. KBS0727]|uniref:DNA gyrase inhibitor YacG n=1 Tax=unclassified Bradyrhizobium TaxID=2631580 RepID=UPI00110F3A3C|nr:MULTISPECIES: DNA gyrase inhibitor YacG [unclassified Bradyrhizobium]QDW36448.1 DNA gyrase inhibitor YacG [Bradyrhizobium sp. KBS0725]QDW43047.1 DNA gyrase inhibitor YacG [Bradyrhizobium sp. KBS0727]